MSSEKPLYCPEITDDLKNKIQYNIADAISTEAEREFSNHRSSVIEVLKEFQKKIGLQKISSENVNSAIEKIPDWGQLFSYLEGAKENFEAHSAYINNLLIAIGTISNSFPGDVGTELNALKAECEKHCHQMLTVEKNYYTALEKKENITGYFSRENIYEILSDHLAETLKIALKKLEVERNREMRNHSPQAQGMAWLIG